MQSDSFFGLGLIEAAKKYLGMIRKPQSTTQIAEALQAGGFHTASKNFKNTVTSVLHRHSASIGDIIRVKKEWGLAEWYPGLKKGRGGNKAEANGNDLTEGGAIKDEKHED
jgi:hypothetical protein